MRIVIVDQYSSHCQKNCPKNGGK